MFPNGRNARGLARYIDWAVANAILPSEAEVAAEHGGESDPSVERIHRNNVPELDEIAYQARIVQSTVDSANNGLNPLGLGVNALPFDISPIELDAGKTHFEQIWERANVALNNAVTTFNRAAGGNTDAAASIGKSGGFPDEC